MALTLDECATIIDAARRSGVHLVVGHSHSFDAPVRRLRALIESGDFGRVHMINAINYTDYLYRPRRPEELDTARGGGAVFNQAAHQVDIVRLIGGGRVASVRAARVRGMQAGRPKVPMRRCSRSKTAPSRRSPTTATAISIPMNFRAGSGRWAKQSSLTRAIRRRFATPQDELAFKNARNYGGAEFRPPARTAVAHQHFGTVLVSCERADLRALPNGVMIYQNGSARLDALPPPTVPRAEVIDELYRGGRERQGASS